MTMAAKYQEVLLARQDCPSGIPENRPKRD
jgi:hypothetical protein